MERKRYRATRPFVLASGPDQIQVRDGDVLEAEGTDAVWLDGSRYPWVKGRLPSAVKLGWLIEEPVTQPVKSDVVGGLIAQLRTEREKDQVRIRSLEAAMQELEDTLANYREWKERIRKRLVAFFGPEASDELTDEEMLTELIRQLKDSPPQHVTLDSIPAHLRDPSARNKDIDSIVRFMSKEALKTAIDPGGDVTITTTKAPPNLPGSGQFDPYSTWGNTFWPSRGKQVEEQIAKTEEDAKCKAGLFGVLRDKPEDL